jgi:hypothetical protein
MPTTRGNTLIAVFEDQEHAQRALRDLRQAGFRDEQLGLASRHAVPAAPERSSVEAQERAGEGAVAGAAVGAGAGALAGAAAAALVPGVGPFLAGGLLATLGGAALGAAVGTFAGPFIALGLSEDEAQFYARHVEQGRTVVLVRTDDRKDEASAILERHGPYDDSMKAKP